MDIPTPVTPVPVRPASRFTLTTKHRRTLLIVAVALLVAVISYVGYRYWESALLIPKNHVLTIAADGLPLSAIQSINLNDGSLAPLDVEGQGTAIVVDASHTDAHGYYLISNPNYTQANLYRQDRNNMTAGLEELTHSSSLKYDLSIDELSGVAAYVAVPGDGMEGHVTVWSPLTKKEADLGVGLHPVLLPGGFFVIFERDGKILSMNIESGDEYEIFTLTPGAVYAIDGKNMKVALYIPAVGLIQHFSIASSVGANFESEVVAPAAPQEMAFLEGKLVTAATDLESGELVLSKEGEATRVMLLAPLPGSYKFTLLHD